MLGVNFSKAFLEKFGSIIGLFWDKQWPQVLIRYNTKGLGYSDIRDVFRCTAEGELFLKQTAEGLKRGDADVTMAAVYSYVNGMLKYEFDSKNYGKVEFWADPYTILKKGVDDCDGYAVLIAKLAWLAGIPRYRLKVAAGEIVYPSGVKGGHAFCLYLKEADNVWYTIEGSFYVDEARKRFRRGVSHDEAPRYGVMWWTTTDEISWSQKDLTIRSGLV